MTATQFVWMLAFVAPICVFLIYQLATRDMDDD